MTDMTPQPKDGRVTTVQLFDAIQALTNRVQALEHRFDLQELNAGTTMRRIAHDVAINVNQANTDRFEALVQRVESSANGMQRVFSELIAEQGNVQRRMARVEAEQDEVRRLIRDTQAMSASVQSSLSLISDLIKARDAQVAEHAHDIDALQQAIAITQREHEGLREAERDLRFRMGTAIQDIVGYNPAVPEATRRFPNFTDRLQSVEQTTRALQADVEAVRVAVGAIESRFDAIGQTINRILPLKVRRVVGNVWFLRAVAALLGALGISGASDALTQLLTP